MTEGAVEGEVGGKPRPTLQDLNEKAIKRLYDIMDDIDTKTDPELIRACVESVAKLNTSIKGSNILRTETAEEKQQRETAEVLEAEING